MTYQRLRPRGNDDAQRDRNRDAREGAYDAYRHDTRGSPFRAQAGGGRAPSPVTGATTPAPEPMRVEVLRFAVVGPPPVTAGDHTFSILAAYDNGEVERIHGPIALPQGGAGRPVAVAGMAYGLGGSHIVPRPSHLYLLDSNNDRVIPYDLSTGLFGHSVTGVPDDAHGVTVASPFDETATRLLVVRQFTTSEGARGGFIYASTRLSAGAFTGARAPARLATANSRPSGVTYLRGLSESSSDVWVVDQNRHAYDYREVDINNAIRGSSQAAASEYDLAPAGGTPANTHPSAIAYGLRPDGRGGTVQRLYVADNTARRIFAYGLPGPTDTALPRHADEDILFGADGLDIGAGAVYGLASFPTSVEAATHANMAIPHGPPPVPRGTPRLALVRNGSVGVLALTDPPRLVYARHGSGLGYSYFPTRSTPRPVFVAVRSVVGVANGVLSNAGTVFRVTYGTTMPTASRYSTRGSNSRSNSLMSFAYSFANGSILQMGGSSDMWPLAERPAGARQSRLRLPVSWTDATSNNVKAFALGTGIGRSVGTLDWRVYVAPMPGTRASGTSIELEDVWDVDIGSRQSYVAVGAVSLPAGRRIGVLNASTNTIMMFTEAGTRMASEDVALNGLVAEDGSAWGGGIITNFSTAGNQP